MEATMTIINKSKRTLMDRRPKAVDYERQEFASKIRAARAVLGWSQAELGMRAGVTQRSINRLENADVDVRRSTAVAIETVLREQGIDFERRHEGGFQMVVMKAIK
jgi:DNA-binding XRE family transcriptional regulator